MVQPTERPTILVVDDTPDNIQLLDGLLRPHYRIRAALNGAKALEIAARSPQPDLILLDVMMPEMDGYAVCRHLKANPATREIPVIFVTARSETADETLGFELGAADYLTKPVSPPVVLARVKTHLALHHQNRELERKVKERTAQLEATQEALRVAMKNLRVTEITPGVCWLQVPEAELHVLCGCPAEVVKHMMRRGYVVPERRGGVTCETGPNAILLSERTAQNGDFANLAEFPVLQMLYRQGLLLPGHPNNTGAKPLLIGTRAQVTAQMAYIHRGNYGLLSTEELTEAGVEPATAELMMRIKRRFAFGTIHPPEHILTPVVVEGDGPVAVKNGVTVQRTAPNRFRFAFRGREVDVDLNLPPGVTYQAPYTLDFHQVPREHFAVLHAGEGDGWDIHRPSMSSILMFEGRIHLVDAPPNVNHTLKTLGIDLSEVAGVFHTHAHDDHFAGLLALLNSDHRIPYYATPMVRASVDRKLAALLGDETGVLERFFQVRDLLPDTWNDCAGLQVQPLHSPHPVETNILLFRATLGDTARSYAHWADLSSFQLLEGMAGDGPDQVPPAFIQQIKAAYLTPADVKKLDIGGGLIHGRAEDFVADPSPRITLAHIARELSDTEKEIGSAAPFGSLDLLIPAPVDYLRHQARHCLEELFPQLEPPHLEELATAPLREANPGSILRKGAQDGERLEMLLTGCAEYLHSQAGVRRELSRGALIGEPGMWGAPPSPGTWRAVSHVRLLDLPLARLRTLLTEQGILEPFRRKMEEVAFLRETTLLGSKLGLGRLLHLAHTIKSEPLAPGAEVGERAGGDILLVRSGELLPLAEGDAALGPGEWLGLLPCGGALPPPRRYRAAGGTRILRLPLAPLLEIPVVHWRLREAMEQRLPAQGEPPPPTGQPGIRSAP